MHTTLLTFSLLLLATRLGAQAVGDSLRVRQRSGTAWVAGRLVQSDTLAFTLRSEVGDQQYRFSEVARIDRWKRDNVVVRVLGSAAGAALGWQLGREIAHDGRPATGSRGGDIALSAGMGTLFGLISYAIAPGSWHRVRRR